MSGQDGEVGPFPELTDCGLQRSGSHFFEMFGIATVSGALKMKAPQGKHHKVSTTSQDFDLYYIHLGLSVLLFLSIQMSGCFQ